MASKKAIGLFIWVFGEHVKGKSKRIKRLAKERMRANPDKWCSRGPRRCRYAKQGQIRLRVTRDPIHFCFLKHPSEGRIHSQGRSLLASHTMCRSEKVPRRWKRKASSKKVSLNSFIIVPQHQLRNRIPRYGIGGDISGHMVAPNLADENELGLSVGVLLMSSPLFPSLLVTGLRRVWGSS